VLYQLDLPARDVLVVGWLDFKLVPLTAPRKAAQNHPKPTSGARDRAAMTHAVATLAVIITLVFGASDVWTLPSDPAQWARTTRSDFVVVVLCTTLSFALHVWHVVYYAVRSQRPPAAAWTLPALAIAIAAGIWFGGLGWTRQLAILAVSVLIIVRGRWALPCVVIIVLTPLALMLTPLVVVHTQWYSVDGQLPGIYFALAIAWRTAAQFVPLYLLAVLRTLDAATHELEARACISARARIESEVRRRIGPTLRQIVVRGEASRAIVETDPSRALAELQQLVGESRRGLAEARRVAASYRSSSLRADLDAVITLLEASGARVQLRVEDGLSLDAAGTANLEASRSLRTAVAAALGHGPGASYRIHVLRDDAGLVQLFMTSDETPPRGGQEQP
jgi:signal transduction histidine kinase